MSAQIVHGGALDQAMQRYGGARDTWLELSTGINPNPWPGAGKLPDIDPAIWHRLPDSKAEQGLLETARKAYGISDGKHIVAANGTQTLIELLPRVLSSERIAILSPTYQEHKLSWIKAGRHVTPIALDEDLPRLANGLVVVNPNNPDGHQHSLSWLEAMSDELALRHGWLIVDEAFCDVDPSLSMAASRRDNVIILRSFGKFFGLAGVRLGFAIASPKITTQLSHQMGPWSVSGPALEIGARALGDETWIEATRRRLPELSQKLAETLARHGFEIVGSNPLFVLANHKDARKIHERLCEQHVLTRRFPDQPQWLRFGLCANEAELQRLDEALAVAVTS